jgi:hypothetical protein
MSVGRRSSADTAKSEAWLSLRIVEKLRLRHSSFDLGVVASTIRVSSFRARGMIGWRLARIPKLEGFSFELEASRTNLKKD